MKKNYILETVLAAFVFGILLPQTSLVLKPYLIYFLAALTFLSLFRFKITEIISSIKQPKEEITILLIQFLITPLIVLLFKPFINPDLFLGLIIAVSIPVAVSTIFLASIYGGKVEEEVTVVTVSHLLSPILVPLLVLLFTGASVSISFSSVAILILKAVIAPVILVELWHLSKITIPSQNIVGKLSSLFLFLIIWPVIAGVRFEIFTNPKMVLAGVLISAVCLVTTFILGFYSQKDLKEKITVAIGASNKNFTLAAVIAFSLFGPAVALGPVAYTLTNSLFFALQKRLLEKLK